MNSILQCLLATPYLNSWFLNDYKKTEKLRNHKLSSAYYEFLKEAKTGNGSSTIVTPSDLKHAIGKRAPQFMGYG